MNNFVYLILTKCSRLQALRSFAQILLKSCFHRFTEIFFSKIGSAGFSVGRCVEIWAPVGIFG